MKTSKHFWSYLAQFFLEWEIRQIKTVEKIETHILYSIFFFFKNRAVSEIMSKNMVESDKPAMTARHILFAFCITEATVTQSEYVLLIAFPQQQWFHERA